jgi:HK97 family phage prohead protease
MNKIFNLVSSFEHKELSDKGVNISGLASTNAIDRVGDVIEPSAWTKGGLDNFKKNPIILFNHNHDNPIGRAKSVAPVNKGLQLDAFISKHAPNNVAQLIEDGVLGAFSVGFMVKDADYIEETGGLKIKDAELFEVSVVSVPCNQAATFSLAKSFDSVDEYEDFKKTFTNRADLTGQSLTGKEVNASNSVSDASEGAPESAHKEIKEMDNVKSNTPDLEALAKRIGEETARNLELKDAARRAKDKAQAEAAEAEARKQKELEGSIDARVQTGVEKLVEDMKAEMTAKDAQLSEIMKKFEETVAEKAQELTNMQNSKRVFVDRGNMSVADAVRANAEAVKQAHLLGVITGKGWNTDFGRNLLEKAGLDYSTDTAATGVLDEEVRDLIQKEIWVQTKVASLFREIQVNGRATILPLQSDTGYAEWVTADAAGNLENRTNIAANSYKARSVTMTVDRMVSSTFIDNDTDEKTLVNLLPMLFDGVSRAHARRFEESIMVNVGTDAHIDDFTANALDSGVSVSIAGSGATAANLLSARSTMGKYGLMPSDLAYVVSMEVYYDLLQDAEFQNLNEVGEIATKLRGVVGGIFGSPVIVSEEFPAQAAGAECAFVVNRNNYVIPKLRDVRVETDYEVANQRRMIVASQSLGFTELFAGDGAGNEPVVAVTWAT